MIVVNDAMLLNVIVVPPCTYNSEGKDTLVNDEAPLTVRLPARRTNEEKFKDVSAVAEVMLTLPLILTSADKSILVAPEQLVIFNAPFTAVRAGKAIEDSELRLLRVMAPAYARFVVVREVKPVAPGLNVPPTIFKVVRLRVVSEVTLDKVKLPVTASKAGRDSVAS